MITRQTFTIRIYRIFGLFNRLNRSDEYEVMGIVLPVYMSILAVHHGRISAMSRHGMGSKFSNKHSIRQNHKRTKHDH